MQQLFDVYRALSHIPIGAFDGRFTIMSSGTSSIVTTVLILIIIELQFFIKLS